MAVVYYHHVLGEGLVLSQLRPGLVEHKLGTPGLTHKAVGLASGSPTPPGLVTQKAKAGGCTPQHILAATSHAHAEYPDNQCCVMCRMSLS